MDANATSSKVRAPADTWSAHIRPELPYFWDDSAIISVCTELITTSFAITRAEKQLQQQQNRVVRKSLHTCCAHPYQGGERFVKELVPRARRVRGEIVLSASLCDRHEQHELDREVDRFLNSRLVIVDLGRIFSVARAARGANDGIDAEHDAQTCVHRGLWAALASGLADAFYDSASRRDMFVKFENYLCIDVRLSD